MSEPARKLDTAELLAEGVPVAEAPPPENVIPLPSPSEARPAIQGASFSEVMKGLAESARTMFQSPFTGPHGGQLREAHREIMLSRTMVLIWLSMVVMPSANLGYAAIMIPDQFWPIAAITGSAIVLVNIQRYLVIRGVYHKHYQMAMVTTVGIVFGMVCGTVLGLTQDAEFTFLFAYVLVYFAFTSLFPAEAKWILATGGVLMGTYAIGYPLTRKDFAVDAVFLANLYYLSQLTFIGVIINRVVAGLFFQERLAKVELGHAYDELQELDRDKTTFFSNISHELRTPLTLVLTPLTHMIRHEAAQFEPGTVDKLKGMRGNANRLLKMVNSLLDFSRLEAGRVDVITGALSLDDILGHISSLFRGTAEQREIDFVVDNQAEGLTITSDLDMIEQILVNLVGNAMKFTESGGTITLGARRDADGRSFHLWVNDTGVGIAPEHQSLVFRRFAQIQKDQNVSVRGTGLGLSMVREYARLLGGAAALESERGVGSTFTITLPITSEGIAREPSDKKTSATEGRSSMKDDLAVADLDHAKAETDRVRNNAPADAPRLLVVDDNPALVNLVCSIVESRYNLFLAYNGEEALDRLSKDKVDLVLSDVMMPGISGLELCERIRADETIRHIPVILLTARGTSTDKIEGLDIGADDYIGKPFDPEELLARIRSLFERRRLVKQLHDKSVALEAAMTKLKDEEVKLIASEKLRTMGDLAAGIFHELHNYMNMIYNGAQPLKELVGYLVEDYNDVDPESMSEINDLLDLMIQASNAALSVTGELKSYAHHTANVVKRVDLHATIKSSIKMFGQLRPGSDVLFEFHETTPELECVQSRLLMVFTNLAKNAFEAMDGDGQVIILTEPVDDKHVLIKVRDSGPGVPADVQETLFQPFHTTKKQGEGLGLGLSLSAKVVTELGGTILYDTEYTDGAQFLITLPGVRWK